jgi:outer membrane protein assembly factor BamB/fermentation-respiration switch protein FrsA (DUF1100 family)
MTNRNRNRIKVEASSLTVLLVSVLILSALAGVQFIGKVSALEYIQYEGTLDGADWGLRIPDPWNGMLVVICRGYSDVSTIPVNTLNWFGVTMLNKGFAVAASNYGSVGYCSQAGVDSTYELTMHVIDNYNVTGKVFLYGFSMGGGVALLLGEKYPDVYSGVLDLFGTKDLKEQHTTKSRWANLTDEELTAELTALDIAVPPEGYATLDEFRTECASMVPEFEFETGGTPATHPQAYEDCSPTYHANITIPVITIHGTADPLVPFYESIMYQTAVDNTGHSHLYRLYNVTDAGHLSASIIAEVPARFDELVAWSDALTGEPTDWPMFRHDLTHNGYSESPAPNTNQTLWTSAIGGMAGSHPAVANGKVYLSAWDALFYCFDASTGVQIWNYTSGEMSPSSPAVADGRVYVGSDDDKLYCLDAETGTLLWNYTTGGDAISSPAVANGKVYFGSKDSNLYCLSADSGQVEWIYTTGASIELSSPAVANGKVYIGSDDNKTYCLDASNGDLIWSYLTGGQIWSSPAVVDGRLYVGSDDANVYCLDAETGELIWNYTTGDIIGYSSPAVAYGKIYVGSHDANVYCLDAADGELIWNYTTGGAVWGSPTVADGKVYVGSFDRKFYCLDAMDGALIWSYTTGNFVLSSPVVANGVAYAVSADQTVYAFSMWVPTPEGLSIGVMLLLSTAATIVGVCILRRRPKWKRW